MTDPLCPEQLDRASRPAAITPDRSTVETPKGLVTRFLVTRLVAAASLVALVLTLTVSLASPAAATDAPATEDPAATDEAPTAEDEAYNELLLQGANVYTGVCSGCHQPGGAGLSGQFPPLNGNPNVQDTEYVAGVIQNGKSGEITVLGTTYNGVMPAFATLPDDEVAAVIAYIQSGFVTPVTADTPAPSDTGPVAGTQLPGLANMAVYLAFAIALAGGALALAPRVVDANDRLDFPWLDAWLRTALIVIAVIVFVVYIPSWALQTETVGKLGDFGQQVIGVGLWAAGLGVVLGALWYAHKENRI